MTISDYIHKIADKLRELGFTVDLYADDLPDKVAGQIDYEKRHIRMHEERAVYALITLAHEAGHASHYLSDPTIETTVPKQTRERYAWVIGATWLAWAGCIHRLDITSTYRLESAIAIGDLDMAMVRPLFIPE